MNFKFPALLPVAILALLATGVPASAEIVFLSSGRTLSVKSHKVDGDSIVLTLRSGGQVTCDKSLIEKIEADEVPYGEPEPPKTEEPSAPPFSRAGRFWMAPRTAKSSRRHLKRMGWIPCWSAP